MANEVVLEAWRSVAAVGYLVYTGLVYAILIGGGLFVARTGPQRVWTVAEAKAHLSEILRLAQSEGPQRIGARRSFVVVPADAWDNKANPRKPLGRWLIENMPRGVDLEIPDRRSAREVPFSDEDDE